MRSGALRRRATLEVELPRVVHRAVVQVARSHLQLRHPLSEESISSAFYYCEKYPGKPGAQPYQVVMDFVWQSQMPLVQPRQT